MVVHGEGLLKGGRVSKAASTEHPRNSPRPTRFGHHLLRRLVAFSYTTQPQLTVDNPRAMSSRPTRSSSASSAHSDAAQAAPSSPASSDVRVGARITVRWKDATEHLAEVVELRSKGPRSEYYVTFVGENRRLDEWITQERICAPLPLSQIPVTTLPLTQNPAFYIEVDSKYRCCRRR